MSASNAIEIAVPVPLVDGLGWTDGCQAQSVRWDCPLIRIWVFRAATVRERGLTLVVRVIARFLTVAAPTIRIEFPDGLTALSGHGLRCVTAAGKSRKDRQNIFFVSRFGRDYALIKGGLPTKPKCPVLRADRRSTFAIRN